MNPIQFECPHCHEVIIGDESQYGQKVKCKECHAMIIVPLSPRGEDAKIARLIPGPAAVDSAFPSAAEQETEIFNLSPAVRAFPGPILLALIFLGLAAGLQYYAKEFPWATSAALGSLAVGALLLVVIWTQVKSSNYRLTTQRLFVRRGWLAKRVEELELYRVKDVRVDQSILQRVLGYGTITVVSEDDTTPHLNLVGITCPTKNKELIRTNYRAARQREGVRPTEFMNSA